MGLKKLKHSTLRDANNRVPYQGYESVFYSMFKKCNRINHQTSFKFKNPLYPLDSRTIDLWLSVFDWANNIITTVKEADVTIHTGQHRYL